jgi:hypothetical protein
LELLAVRNVREHRSSGLRLGLTGERARGQVGASQRMGPGSTSSIVTRTRGNSKRSDGERPSRSASAAPSSNISRSFDAEVVAKALAWTDHDPLAGVNAPCACHLDDAKSAFDLKLPLASHDHDRLMGAPPRILPCRAMTIARASRYGRPLARSNPTPWPCVTAAPIQPSESALQLEPGAFTGGAEGGAMLRSARALFSDRSCAA